MNIYAENDDLLQGECTPEHCPSPRDVPRARATVFERGPTEGLFGRIGTARGVGPSSILENVVTASSVSETRQV